MIRSFCCNLRAGFFLVVLGVALGGTVMPAWGQGYLFDPGGSGGDTFGSDLAMVPDMNGDGRDEFLVGIAESDANGLGAGQAFLWFGGSEVTLAPDLFWNGSSAERFGAAVAAIGDVNNDDVPDFAVGAPLSNAAGLEAGRVYVFYGGASPSATPDKVISGANAGDHFGHAISAAGDFDGDGRDDFIVGAPYSDLAGVDAGAAYIIYGGGGAGPSTDLAAATVLAGEIAGDLFGFAVSDAGNFLGGPRDAVAVGAPLNNTHGGLDAGALYVFEGAASPDTTIDFVVGISAGNKAAAQFGYSVRNVGRLDTDGYDDLAVGAPYCNEVTSEGGRVEFFLGDPNPSIFPDATVDGAGGGGRFGWSLERVGDVIGGSRDDVLIGAPFLDLDGLDSGRAYLYTGGSSASNASQLAEISDVAVRAGTRAGDQLGLVVGGGGDFDGDGTPDYAVAAPYGDVGSTGAQAGFAALFHSTAGPVPALLRHWRARWLDAGSVELEFVLASGPDAVASLAVIRNPGTTDETVPWSGPARGTDDGRAGVLLHTADGFVFRDAVTGTGAPTYALAVDLADGGSFRLTAPSGPGERPATVPVVLALQKPWPNPANPAVRIRFVAPQGEPVALTVLDVRGRVVRRLAAGAGTGTWQDATWRGATDSGAAAPSGVYFVQVVAGTERRIERVVLAR